MEGMDLFDELERLALNASEDADSFDEEPSDKQVTRWQHLFHYSSMEDVDQIRKKKNDINRSRVSEEHWECVQLRKEAEGYDREAYEHQLHLGLRKPFSPPASTVPSATKMDNATYLFKLVPPLDSSSTIQTALSRPTPPIIRRGEGSHGVEFFCELDSATKQSIQSYLFTTDPTLLPTFIRISKAAKSLSPNSAHPTLGIDATSHSTASPLPKPGISPPTINTPSGISSTAFSPLRRNSPAS